VQETLQRSKNSTVSSEQVKHTHAASFAQAIDDLEKSIGEKIAALKAGAAEGEQIVEKESQRAEQAISSLRENIATLEGKLKDSEDTARRKNSASQEMEQSLNTQLRGLESDLSKKSQTLQGRDTEVRTLKSNVDVLARRASELEGAIKDAHAEA